MYIYSIFFFTLQMILSASFNFLKKCILFWIIFTKNDILFTQKYILRAYYISRTPGETRIQTVIKMAKNPCSVELKPIFILE